MIKIWSVAEANTQLGWHVAEITILLLFGKLKGEKIVYPFICLKYNTHPEVKFCTHFSAAVKQNRI